VYLSELHAYNCKYQVHFEMNFRNISSFKCFNNFLGCLAYLILLFDYYTYNIYKDCLEVILYQSTYICDLRPLKLFVNWKLFLKFNAYSLLNCILFFYFFILWIHTYGNYLIAHFKFNILNFLVKLVGNWKTSF